MLINGGCILHTFYYELILKSGYWMFFCFFKKINISGCLSLDLYMLHFYHKVYIKCTIIYKLIKSSSRALGGGGECVPGCTCVVMSNTDSFKIANVHCFYSKLVDQTLLKLVFMVLWSLEINNTCSHTHIHSTLNNGMTITQKSFCSYFILNILTHPESMLTCVIICSI